MSKKRLVYQNWIVELGVDPGKISGLKDRYQPEVEMISLEDLSDMECPGGVKNSSSERQLIQEVKRQAYLREKVARALDKLMDDEKEFIERFYYIGQSYREISEKSGRAVYKLEAIHKRAVKKLKKELAPLAAELYHLEIKPATSPVLKACVICSSAYRVEIDKLIAERNRRGTWRPIIKTLKEKYGLIIDTPQVLIGHEKYH